MPLPNQPSILIAEDDSDDRYIILTALNELGIDANYLMFDNGEHLMDYLHSDNLEGYPSLILLDLNLPCKDGREALREIKTDWRLKSIPTVILTTSSSPYDTADSYNLGANGFITKPSGYQEFLDTMRAVMRIWHKSNSSPE